MKQWNPNGRSRARKGETYWGWWNSERAPRFSGTIRLMQRPELKSRVELDDDGCVWRSGRRKEEERRRGKGKKWKGPPDLIYKGERISDRRKNRGAQRLDLWQSCHLDCRRLINEGEICAIFNHRWRHDGLSWSWKMTSRRFTRFLWRWWRRNFSQVLKIDMNQFKSIWGLMLGILLLGINRPGEARLPP